MIDRRTFISAALGLGAAANLRASGRYEDLQSSVFYKPVGAPPKQIIKPPALRRGSKVAITAPASPTNKWEIRNGIRALESLGCKIEIGKTITEYKSSYKYLAAPDEKRAEELTRFVERKDVDAILCARGGYGVMRILPSLDFETIRANAKPIIGFSDITALINPIYAMGGIAAFHGPVASSSFNSFSLDYFKKVLAPDGKFEPVKISYYSAKTAYSGKVRGKLAGGNLSMLVATLGTPYEVDARDAILIIEDVSEHAYRIDRMLTQLWLAGKIDQCAGVAFGHFSNLNTRKSFYPGRQYTIKQVIIDKMRQYGKPSVYELPFGHYKDNATLPLGVEAELDADARTLTITEPAVEIA